MSFVRSTVLVGAAAALSRLLGFARDVMFAQALGAGPAADAFLAAFRLPNLLRRVLGEGGLNPAVVPTLARLPPAKARLFAGEALSTAAFALLALTALVEIAAGVIAFVLAPGLAGNPETLALATLYTRLSFPLVFGVTLASFVAAVLHHERRFAAAAIAPLVVNAGLIGTLLILEFLQEGMPPSRKAAWLAAASSIAGFVQLGIVGLALARDEMPIRLARPRWSPDIGRLLWTALLTITANAAMQLFVLVATQAASFRPSLISWLYYADRVVQLPLGFIASSVGIVLLPELAARHVAGEKEAVDAAQARALELSAAVALPAAVALAVLAEPIAVVLFERGAFGPADSQGTAMAMAGLAAALPFAVAAKVFSHTLFARGALRSPILAVVAGVVATLAAALLLTRWWGALGIGLGVCIGSMIQALILAGALRRAGLLRGAGLPLARLIRIGLSAGILGVALAAARALVAPSPLSLAAICLAGLALYAAVAVAIGAVRREELALLSKNA